MGTISEVRVRVPGSSANLGPGFDSLGLALGLYDDVEVSVAPDGVVVEVLGEGAGQVPCDDAHLVVQAMRRTWDLVGDAPPGIRMRCRNAIPHSRGLGSSAAAAVAGAVAAVALSGRDMELERETLLQVTAGMEGHADNAAASLLGGFVVAWETNGNFSRRFHAVRLDAHPGIHPVALVAGVESLTSTTRGLLPATEDRLHQEYRRPAYPDSAELMDALRARGVPAAISGAGPTVLALTADGGLPADVDLHGFTALPLPVDTEGARVELG